MFLRQTICFVAFFDLSCSCSTHRFFLAWLFELFLLLRPYMIASCGAFEVVFLSCSTHSFFSPWLFEDYLVPAPRFASSQRGFLRTILLLRHVLLLLCVAFFDLSCSCDTHRFSSAWLFLTFTSSAPPNECTLWGFWGTILLLRHISLLPREAFEELFLHRLVTKNELIILSISIYEVLIVINSCSEIIMTNKERT